MSSLDWLFGLERLGVKFGLDNITTITAELGHPERAFRSVHIAGTNGKGSVAAMVESGLRAAGHKTGRFTSPHLVNVEERFAIDGVSVETAELQDAAAHLESVTKRLLSKGLLDASPTFFEATTALAFEIFRQSEVDVGVIEVGLGGRLDSTNVLSPTVSVITTIGFDHQMFLGDTLGQIACEKAGIIKPGTPVVIGRLPPQGADVIREVADRRKARLANAGEDTRILGVTTRTGGTSITALETPVRRYEAIELPLAGVHQAENAAVAVRTMETLDACGVAVPPEAVVAGLSRFSWPGRLDHRRLPGGRELLMDAAHNTGGAAALAAFLAADDAQRFPLVFGALADKDIGEMLRVLAPAVGAIILVRAANPRFLEPADIVETVRTAAHDRPVVVATSIPKALETAWRISPRIVIAGSLFLVGDVMKELDLS